MRGTVWVIPEGHPERTTKHVLEFQDAAIALEFQERATRLLTAGEDLLGPRQLTIEFGPIGPPWGSVRARGAT